MAEVLDRSTIDSHEAEPADRRDGPWLSAPEGRLDLLRSVMGGDGLPARKGTTTDFNNAYWFELEGTNAADASLQAKNNLSAQGHQVAQESVWLEADILFPLAKGKEVTRFNFAGPTTWILLPQRAMAGMPEKEMRDRFPKAWAYLSKYIKTACTGACKSGSGCRLGLEGRASYKNPKYGKGMGVPWAIWNVGAYTFTPYKVAWKEIGGFEAAVLSSAPDPLGRQRVIVPDHKLMFLPCTEEGEAHFYCGILNSRVVSEFAEASSLSTSRGARIFEHLRVPKYEATPAQEAVADLSRRAHEASALDDGFDVELDAAVAEILGGTAQWRPHVVVNDPAARLREVDGLAKSLGVEPGTAGKAPLDGVKFVALDMETTGFHSDKLAHKVIELAAVRFDLAHQETEEVFETRIWPCRPISFFAERAHGITEEELRDAPVFEDIADRLAEFIGDRVLVAHNAAFEASFLATELGPLGVSRTWEVVDTLAFARNILGPGSNDLASLCKRLSLPIMANHSARRDAEVTALLLRALVENLPERGRTPLARLDSMGARTTIKVVPTKERGASRRYARGTKVSLLYGVAGETRRFTGRVLGYAIGSDRGYLSLEVGPTRLCLRLERIIEQEAVKP